MALTLAQSYIAAVDTGTNTTRVAAAVAIAASAVLTESGGTPNHAARLAWAQKTLNDPVTMGKKVIWGVVADANVQAAGANPSDAIVQTSVNSLVDTFVNA